jgi:hypothetical protein
LLAFATVVCFTAVLKKCRGRVLFDLYSSGRLGVMKATWMSKFVVARNSGAVAGLMLALAVGARAQLSNAWINPASSKWEIGANWSLGVAPSNRQAIVGITRRDTMYL